MVRYKLLDCDGKIKEPFVRYEIFYIVKALRVMTPGWGSKMMLIWKNRKGYSKIWKT
jgi:hypothetical protein